MYSTTADEKKILDASQQIINLKDLTDREIQERQLKLLSEIEKSNNRIKLNLQFWFYFTLIGGLLTFFVMNNLK
jgi:hypothetical protein